MLRRRSPPLPALVPALLAAGVACEDTRVLSGSFRSDAFVASWDAAGAGDIPIEETSLGGPSLAAAFQDLSLELVLGHFGPEVAGLAKFRKVRGSGQCPCARILEGRYSGRRFTFKFTADFTSECLSLGSLRFQASLSLRPDGTLDGHDAGYVEVTPPGSPETTQRFQVRLGRDKRQEDLNAMDLSCEGFSTVESP